MSKAIERDEFLDNQQKLDVEIGVNSVIATCDPQSTSSGSLSKVAVLIKDNIEAIGLPGSAGSLALIDSPAKRDAELVSKLRSAGADIVGSTNLSEWANLRSTKSISGWSAVGGLTRNPWNLAHSVGGSSAGSGAAVGAGIVTLAIGTETDGSIVCPASLNGVVGLKPTVGSVSTHGVVPISSTQDTPGPIAANVEWAAKGFDALSGQDTFSKLANASNLIAKLRVGVAENWLTGDTETDAVFENAIAVVNKLVAKVSASSIPEISEQAGEDEYTILLNEIKDEMAQYLAGRPGTHAVKTLEDIVNFNYENAATEMQFFGQEHFESAIASPGKKSIEYQTALRRGTDWARRVCFENALEQHELFIAPTYGPAWINSLGDPDNLSGGKVTSPAAVAGYPLLCIPMGLVNGLPVGLTIAGPANSEATMLALGYLLEQNLGCRPEDGFKPTFKKAD
jgi:amidase